MLKLLSALLFVLALAACGGDNVNNLNSGNGDSASSGNGGGHQESDGFRVLVFSRTSGFRHASIEPGIFTIEQLGAENGFEVDATEDPTDFTPENLAQYAAVIWLNTTLTVLDTEAQRQAFEDFIRNGGGYVGIHSAADTEYDWPFYGELVGAYFQAHPVVNQPGELRIEDSEHPSTAHLGDVWSLPLEEYYSFQSNPRGEVRVLMNINEDSYLQQPNTSCDPSGPTFPEGYSGSMGDHPVSWCHDKYAGRAWYTALGHEIYLYLQDDFRQHILNGILTATRRVPASCAVNAKPVEVPDYIEPELQGCENQLLP